MAAEQRKTLKTNSRGASTSLHHGGKILVFGVLLPIIAVCFESMFHFCAKHFFDPFPSLTHILLFLLIPLSNLLALLACKRDLSQHLGFLTLTSGMSMGLAVMYSIMFLPVFLKSLFFVGAFGFGLLGLSPYLSILCSLVTGRKVRNLSKEHSTYFDPHQVEHMGHLIVLFMVLSTELPSTLTRVHLGMATVAADQNAAVDWLRKYGNSEVMLRACYEHSERATDILGSIYESAHPLAVQDARRIYFQVTGKPFNSVQIPAGARATIRHALVGDPGDVNRTVDDEFDLDLDIAGEAISGVARGLSVCQSEFRANIDGDAMVAGLDWSITLDNASKYDREARYKIIMPPGAVVTRAILHVNDNDYDASIKVREKARQVYRESVMQHRDFPLLVSSCGPDQVLVQCFPVHPNNKTQIRLTLECPLKFKTNSIGTLVLPAFAEKNFQADIPNKLHVEATMPLSIAGLKANQTSCTSFQSGLKSWQLDSDISPNQLSRFEAVLEEQRNPNCKTVMFQDNFAKPHHLVEHAISDRRMVTPNRMIVLIDGSIAMKEFLPEIIKGLADLPNCPTSIVAVKDGEIALSRECSSGSLRDQNVLEKLSKLDPAGGQDDSKSLMKALNIVRTEQTGAVLWIHAAQPICDVRDLGRIRTLFSCVAQNRGNDPERPLLYDLQLVAGPSEILGGVNGCSTFERVAIVGAVSETIRRLGQSWTTELLPEGDRDQHEESLNPLSEPESTMAPPGLAQLLAYKEILRALEEPGSVINNPICLADSYHLVSPVSSAVVTEQSAELKPLSRSPDASQKPFSLERTYVEISPVMNNISYGTCMFVTIPLTLYGCSRVSESASRRSTAELAKREEADQCQADGERGQDGVGRDSEGSANPDWKADSWILFSDVCILIWLSLTVRRARNKSNVSSKSM